MSLAKLRLRTPSQSLGRDVPCFSWSSLLQSYIRSGCLCIASLAFPALTIGYCAAQPPTLPSNTTTSPLASNATALSNSLSEPVSRAVIDADNSVELFVAMRDGTVSVELSALSARSICLKITNPSDQPIVIALPNAFAAVPEPGAVPRVPARPAPFILGQQGFGQGGLGAGALGGGQGLGAGAQGLQGLAGQGQGGQAGGGQGLGGGFNNGGLANGNGGGNGNLFGGNGNGNGAGIGIGNGAGNGLNIGAGLFRIPAGRVGKVFAQTVCLEHGKPDPTPFMKYRIVPLNDFSAASDPRIGQLCRALAEGQVTQNVAQAAAWHLANGLTWQQLADKDRTRSNTAGNQKFFTPEQLEAAYAWTQSRLQSLPSESSAARSVLAAGRTAQASMMKPQAPSTAR